jgi:hypothetical protein
MVKRAGGQARPLCSKGVITAWQRTLNAWRGCRLASVVFALGPIALRLVIAGLLAAQTGIAGAVVFTTDYDRLTVLPALSANGGDVDWRSKGAVTPVKNQGQCDSSWAFAVTGLVEAYNQILGGQLHNLSEQQLLDCTLGSGCGGGSPIAALRTVIARGGLANQASYPYTAREGTCKLVVPVATIPGAGHVPPGDEVSLQGYVARGPVLALVNASPAFDSYKSGIFNGPCSQNNPTQAVLIVGYAQGPGGFWIVKNSLGTTWGSQGYIRMARGSNLCGIANFAIAISNDPLPPAAPPIIPTLSAWAIALLLLGFATLGFLQLRRRGA